MKHAPSYPVLLVLAEGPATYAGKRGDRPQYERNGAQLDIDVRIPTDLARHWFWNGTYLARDDGIVCAVPITSLDALWRWARTMDWLAQQINPLPATSPDVSARSLPTSPAAVPQQLTLW